MRRVVLDVGGTEFVTTVETLTSIPETYFEALFNRWSDGEPSSSSIFLDRDPTHFRHILNFYRNRVVPVGLSAQEKQELSAEAAFYNIQELTSALEGTIQLAIGDTIYLTDSSIEKFGAFLGGYPARSCRICMGMLNPANIFADQCQLCRIPTDRWVWGCLLVCSELCTFLPDVRIISVLLTKRQSPVSKT
ncbi:unnamed protein product, partial [Mesorhabditis spiculigera]